MYLRNITGLCRCGYVCFTVLYTLGAGYVCGGLFPTSAQSLVQLYHCNLLVTYGIAQTYLCIQIRTLCVEHVKIAYYTVHILQLCQLYALLCRLFQFEP